MPKLPNLSDCCGCAACVDICPKEAISLREDKNGFINISLDKTKCVECGLCVKHCHIVNQSMLSWSNPLDTYPCAGWSTDEVLIKASASGAIFAQIAYNFLSQGNSFVYGASLQEDNSVHHIEVSDINDLHLLQNSKYQQSNTVGIYEKVKNRLSQGGRVLFSGVPCQVAALYGFLGFNKDRYPNLYTIDIICHGIPSNDLFRTALKITNSRRIVCFRTKTDDGWIMGANNRVTYESNNGAKHIAQRYPRDFFYRAYLTNSLCRQNCFSCKYANVSRISDLTIGDFWGFEKTSRAGLYKNHMGTSVILPNTINGQWMLSGDQLHIVSTSWIEILPYNQNLFMPTTACDYTLYNKIYLIKRLPLGIKRILYQKGFASSFFDKCFNKILGIFIGKKRRRQLKIRKERLDKVLNLCSEIRQEY